MAIEPYFTQTELQGAPNGSWTSLDFGPDGRLYAAEVNGTIHAYTIGATATGYAVTASQTIGTVAAITNHNDDGTVAAAQHQGARQVTGLLAGPTAGVVYVSSSDPRIGAGPEGGDVNLDTNSGVISRLTQNPDGSWSRVDLVRGLPRSEENHSVNGMQLSADGTKLYISVGGNTNQGAPSNNFAYTPEYALSAAILVIDLVAINALPTKTAPDGSKYKYDLPTLDGNPNDPNQTDPFGGFDGLNQAVIVPGGPVQVYSPGYRNAYDLVLTEDGKLFTIDNGGNAGWGGLPIGEGPASGGTSAATNAPNDGGPETPDHLHLVTQGFYGGFPNPIRANPDGAGWYLNGSSTPIPPSQLPSGWPPVPTADPRQGDFLAPGSDGALYSGWAASTNGLTEYTASGEFGGAMDGDLLAVSWDDQLYRIQRTADGAGVLSVTSLTAGFGVLGSGLPLDVTAQGDGEVFAGTIWVANYGGGITVLTPSDTPPPPPGGDADGDGLSDSVDPFAEDPANGKATDLAAGQTLTWNFSQNIDPPGPNALFNMGFTGLMSNGTQSYLSLYDAANIKAGGASAGFQVEQVSVGDALVGDSQLNAFQFGIDVLPSVSTFTIEVKIDNPFGGDPSTAPVDYKSQGFFIGTGDQDNYLKVVAAANGGAGGIEVATENAGAFSAQMYGAGITGTGIQTLDSITLRLTVNADTGVATPSWTWTVGGAASSGSGAAVQLSGATLQALQGNYSVGGQASGLAVGIISTAYGSGQPFPAFWESIKITADSTPPPDGPQARLSITPGGGINASGWNPNSFKLENLSTAGQELTTVVIDLTGSLFAGMIFDPTGQAGDLQAKGFTIDQATGLSVASATFGGGTAASGYKTLTLQLQDFDPGETLLFSVDVDPASIKGASTPGPGQSGSVSGLELTGASVSFSFGATTLTNEIFEEPGSVGGGTVLAAQGLPAAPTVTVSGVAGSTGTVGAAQQTVVVSGPAGATVRVLVVEGGQFTAGVPAAAPDLGPYEANSAVAVATYDVVLNGSGSGQVAVTLSKTGAEGGLNLITAAVLGSGGTKVGPAAAPVTLRLDTTTPPGGDTDGDGLSDTIDRFALDATNGGANNLASLGTITLGFNSGTTPSAAGLTGAMTNGTDSYQQLVTSGSVSGGKLLVQAGAGDPYGAGNTQKNAYHFGVDTSGVQSFTVQSKVDNPFLNGVALQDYRSAGIVLGAGDQDNYAKLVFGANGGAGGLEFLVENGGSPTGTTFGLGVPVANIAYAVLTIDVVKTAAGATATPRWTLHGAGGAQVGAGSGTGTAMTGALLDAVQGDLTVGGKQSELAVGVIATSFGSSGPFQAAWDELKITAGGTPPPAGVTVTQTGGTTAVTEGGAGDSISVVLSAAPTANVTVTVSGNADVAVAAGGGAAGGSATLTFTPQNWNTAQTIAVTAVNDTLVEGPESANLTFATSSSQAAWNGLTVAPVAVAVTDNDQGTPPAVTVTQTGGATAVTEGGAGDSISVVLSAAPTANVTVTVTGNADVAVAAGGGAAGGSATLTFTPQNWNTAQTIAVTAVNDTLVEGPETANLTFATSSSQAAWNGLTVAPVPVSVTDNDQVTPPATVVVDGSDLVVGNLGAQSWGPLDVSATGWSGAAAKVVQNSGGMGVQGGRYAAQIDHNPSTGASEVLTLGFDTLVDAAVLRISRLSAKEGKATNAEVGAWKAYDAAGALVGEGLLDPRGKTAVSQGTWDFAIDPAAGFETLKVSAVAYNNGAPTAAGEGTDFSVAQITYTPLDAPLV